MYKTTLAIALTFFISISIDSHAESEIDEEYYFTCLSSSAKKNLSKQATDLLVQECRYRATPQKCRAIRTELDENRRKLNLGGGSAMDFLNYVSPPEMQAEVIRKKESLISCIKECKQAKWTSRKFGDCRN